MPPAKEARVGEPEAFCTRMPSFLALILPPVPLLMPPVKVETFRTLMPELRALMSPLLLMPPEKLVPPLTRMPSRLVELTVPVLTMPPAKVETLTRMPVLEALTKPEFAIDPAKLELPNWLIC